MALHVESLHFPAVFISPAGSIGFPTLKSCQWSDPKSEYGWHGTYCARGHIAHKSIIREFLDETEDCLAIVGMFVATIVELPRCSAVLRFVA